MGCFPSGQISQTLAEGSLLGNFLGQSRLAKQVLFHPKKINADLAYCRISFPALATLGIDNVLVDLKERICVLPQLLHYL